VNDPLTPDDGRHERGQDRDRDSVDNVVELRRRASSLSELGHPSGPRSAATVDQALHAIRTGTPSGDPLRAVRAVRPDPSLSLRVALGVLSAIQLGVAGAWLLGEVPFGQIVGSPTAAHLSRDAALGVVLGSIGAIVSWRPRWSLSLLPIVGAVVAVQMIGLIADGSNGQSGFHFEIPHLIAIIVGTLTFAVSRRRRPTTPRR
jgi:hypothetical protein